MVSVIIFVQNGKIPPNLPMEERRKCLGKNTHPERPGKIHKIKRLSCCG
jgi:hypothetical protein